MNAMDETPESRLLDANPGIREHIRSLPEFLRWRAQVPKVEIDDETFGVIGGDRLMDDDQLMVEWARLFRPGLIREV
jgi:hypothetical protein